MFFLSYKSHYHLLSKCAILILFSLSKLGINNLNDVLGEILEDEIIPDLQAKMLNVLKMNVYILSDLLGTLESISSKKAFLQIKVSKECFTSHEPQLNHFLI